jgi:hypothetical protein
MKLVAKADARFPIKKIKNSAKRTVFLDQISDNRPYKSWKAVLVLDIHELVIRFLPASAGIV